MYETTPSFTHYFLQTLAAINKDRITDDLFGDWQFTRGPGRAICELTLGNTAYDTDSFVLALKPGCDALITRFGPVSWKLDRGQFVMLGAKRPGVALRGERGEHLEPHPGDAPAAADGEAVAAARRSRSAAAP